MDMERQAGTEPGDGIDDSVEDTHECSFPTAHPKPAEPAATVARRLPPSALTAAEFQGLREAPTAAEWFANLDNAHTRAAYRRDVEGFMAFAGVIRAEEFRLVTRAHVIAWRKSLEAEGHSASTLRRKLSALSSLFASLCEANAVLSNPVLGVKRPKADSPNEGKTPALGDGQARRLLEAPPADTLKGRRDRAILAVLLFQAIRREELCRLTVADARQERRGVAHFLIHGKGGKTRYLPAHPRALGLIAEYLAEAGHGDDLDGPLFRSVDRRGRKAAMAAADDGGGGGAGGGTGRDEELSPEFLGPKECVISWYAGPIYAFRGMPETGPGYCAKTNRTPCHYTRLCKLPAVGMLGGCITIITTYSQVDGIAGCQ